MQIQKWIAIAVIVLALGLWIFFIVIDQQEVIKEVEIKFRDSFQLYTKESIMKMLQPEMEAIQNNHFEQADIEIVENTMKSNPWVENVSAYVLNQKLNLKISFKKPSMKIIGKNNQLYYVNLEGNVLPAIPHTSIRVPVTIRVGFYKNDSMNKTFLQKLASLGDYLLNDSNWKKQSYYLDAENPQAIKLYTYAPTFIFNLGDMDNYENKLYKVLFFQYYAEKHQLHFSIVDVQYKNQILGIQN